MRSLPTIFTTFFFTRQRGSNSFQFPLSTFSFPFYQRTGWVFVSNSLIYIISSHVELSPWDFSLFSVLVSSVQKEVNDRLEIKINRDLIVIPGSLCIYLSNPFLFSTSQLYVASRT
jgi:hypothetical protein